MHNMQAYFYGVTELLQVSSIFIIVSLISLLSCLSDGSDPSMAAATTDVHYCR